LLGTASFASTALSASFATTSISSSFATTASFAISSSRAVTASFALTASNIAIANDADIRVITANGNGTLNGEANLTFNGSLLNVAGNLIVTGSTAIGTGSLGPFENTLTLGARDTGGEGGQLGFSPSGGTWTSASFIDLYQDRLRILKGTSATSTGEVARFNMHTNQMGLAGYTSVSSFPGTAVGLLAFDSAGNILTTTAGGSGTVTSVATAGTVSGITLTGGTITTSGTITLGGSISGLTNANLSGTAGITNANLANSSITVGSTAISLGTTATTIAGLTSVTSTAFTGSLLGTASWATNVVNNGVTSVATAGSVSGITLTGGTITSTGTITLGGSISGLTNANLSGTAGITNANLANSSITVGSTAISLGGTATTIAGLTSVTSTAFTGSLLGTASFATSALSSSFATTSISSSFATSALSASFATTASFASNGISGLTSNFIPKATSATSLADSGMQDDSTNIIIDRTTIWQGKAAMGSLTTPVGGMVSYVTDADLLAYTGNQWTGEAIRGTAGANITVGQLCYMNTAGRWRPADADANPASTTLLGICLLSASGLGTTFILLKGFVETSYSLGSTPGESLYIEPASGAGAGYVTPIVPTTAGQFVRLIGHTHNGTTIRFNPDNIWIEL
jgi:hypothetical protein